MNFCNLVFYTPKIDPGSPTLGLGVRKKISAQVSALNRLGFKCIAIGGTSFQGGGKGGSIVAKVLKRIRSTATQISYDRRDYREALEKIRKEAPDAVYIRYALTSFSLLRFLDGLKVLEPRPRVVLEIATFPYDGERNFLDWATWEDRFFRNFLRGRVDRIVTITDHPKIFGISTIGIRNGIDVQSVPMLRAPDYDGTQLNFIGVANLNFWTGYDRVLRGLAKFKHESGSHRVKLTIVGNGPVLNDLQDLSKSLSIENIVEFTGRRDGHELDRLFVSKHVAIGSLGMHRINLDCSSNLKIREYTARGIPFVTSAKDDSFISDFKMMKYIAQDESPLDIKEIISFYENIRKENPNYVSDMRFYAEQYLDWKVLMQPVANFLQGVVDCK